jgi:glycerophosphoryl diester phosphodiesterase
MKNATMLLPLWVCILGAACEAGTDTTGAAGLESQQQALAAAPTLLGRAVLPAATFARGPTSGELIGPGPINGQAVPFVDKQPVQGFSALLRLGGDRYLALCDNGFGRLENSADFLLRAYELTVDLKTRTGGSGSWKIRDHISFRDPDRKIPFAITNQFTRQRLLTGADFDVESMQRAPDGTLWLGDEFGPFLLHFDRTGRLLEAPIPLPDFSGPPGSEIRSPQNPLSEEASAVRIMNAVRAHARQHGGKKTPVFSPWAVMLKDEDPATLVDSRQNPPPGSGLTAAASDIFDAASLQSAGYPVVTWTVNDPAQMAALLKLKVDGIISDRPDLLYQAVKAFDANGDGTPGDYLEADGLIDIARFDAQGHRGARNLRPENTLPAFEAALDHLVTTLELDVGVTGNGSTVLAHDPHVLAEKCRISDGTPYGPEDQVLIKDLPLALLQQRFICDKVFRGADQSNDRALSPVAVAFMGERKLDPYAIPRLQEVFDFVKAYAAHYRPGGPGAGHPQAALRAKNAARVRFNIETKINPRQRARSYTVGPAAFARKVARRITDNQLEDRADIQSFDFRTLLWVQEHQPKIRTVYLFGDFARFADPTAAGSDDGTNLQGEDGGNTPWLAGLPWPYRVTARIPFRQPRSGGFEGTALSKDGRSLLAMLEQPLMGGEPATLLIHELSLRTRRYTGVVYKYPLDPGTTAIGDFIMTGKTSGLVIERDGSQGKLDGWKALFEIRLGQPGAPVAKSLLVNLLEIQDPAGISAGGLPGDVGLGPVFAFPFETIEDVVFLGGRKVALVNDNNYPFSVGRHLGAGLPDDSELIVIDVGRQVATD